MSKERIYILTTQLNRYRDSYYNNNESLVSDAEYDKLFDELAELEKEENFCLTNSPTQSVGYKVVDSLKKVKHGHLMLSLDKTKSCEDLVKFAGDKEVCLSMKLDGLTMSVCYENGKLVSAETRGNGVEGTDVLNNAKVMKNLPLVVDYKDRLVIDGECIILRDDFEKINETLPENEKYATQRNLASGSLSLLDNKIASERNLQFWAWSIIEGSTGSFEKDMVFLGSLGFTTVPHVQKLHNESVDMYEYYTTSLKINANELGIPVDGCVITYDDIAYGLSLGNTGHHFRKSLAFKYEDETAPSRLRSITWQVGRTGVISPVAEFDTVLLDNTEVSKASVHNLSIMEELGLSLNCSVNIYKANQIIPQIQSAEKDGTEKITIPDTCPCCGKPTIIKTADSGTKTLNCENPECPAKQLAQFEHFVSKPCANIDGLSSATLETLIDLGFIKTFADIYHLSDHKDEIIKLDGFGEKSYKKLYEAIELSREIKLSNFITSLGIPLIGKTAGKTISKAFNGNYGFFKDAWEHGFDFSTLDDFGKAMADAMNDAWVNPNPLWAGLDKEFSFIVEEAPKVSADDFISGKTFVVTGSFNNYKRSELEQIITDRGGKLSGSVSAKTSFLLTNDGDSGSSKAEKAKKLNIPIMSEDEFIKKAGL